MIVEVKFNKSKSISGYVFQLVSIDGKVMKNKKFIHTYDGVVWATWYDEPESNIKNGITIKILGLNHTFNIDNTSGESVANNPLNLKNMPNN